MHCLILALKRRFFAGYMIEKMSCKSIDEHSEAKYAPCNVLPHLATSYVAEDLLTNKQYKFRVKALNSVGLSQASRSSDLIVTRNNKGSFTKKNFVQNNQQFITSKICSLINVFQNFNYSFY